MWELYCAPRVRGFRAWAAPAAYGPQLLRPRPSSAAGPGGPSVFASDRVPDTPAPIRTLGPRGLRGDGRFTRGAEGRPPSGNPLGWASRSRFLVWRRHLCRYRANGVWGPSARGQRHGTTQWGKASLVGGRRGRNEKLTESHDAHQRTRRRESVRWCLKHESRFRHEVDVAKAFSDNYYDAVQGVGAASAGSEDPHPRVMPHPAAPRRHECSRL
jgi:hypothetical protein